MKKIYTLLSLLLSGGLLYAGNITWTGAVSSDWSNPLNWSAGVPLATDDLVFSDPSALNMPVLDMNRTANSITFSTGTLDLNGFILNLNGSTKTNILSAGTISNGTLDFTNNTSIVTFSGTTFFSLISANVGRVNFNGSTFHQNVVVKRNSTIADNSTGGNTFHALFDLSATAGNISLSTVNPDTYNGVVSVTNQGTGTITFSRSTSSIFNAQVEVNSTSTGTIGFGLLTGPGSPVFNSGFIQGGSLMSSGTVRIDNAIINAAWNVSFNPLGSAVFRIAKCTVNADFTYDGPGFVTGLSTYNNPVTIKRRGASDIGGGGSTFNALTQFNNLGSTWTFNNSTLGNTFNAPFVFTQDGAGEFRLTTSSTSPTVFNSTADFINNTAGIITLAYNGNNQVDFNGPLTWTNNSTGTIRGAFSNASVINVNNTFNISNFSTGLVATANNGTLNLAGVLNFGTFELGTMNFTRVNQTVANPIVANFANDAILSVLSSTILGTFTATVPVFRTQSSIYFDLVNIVQNGNGNGDSYGGNTFHENVAFTNASSARFRTASTAGDTYMKNVSMTYTSGTTQFAYRSENTIGGDLILTSATNPVIAELSATIAFNGSSNQSIILNGGGTRITADNVSLDQKTGGQVNLQTELRITTNINFGDYLLNLNGFDLLITNVLGSATSFANGGILCEDPTQNSGVTWTINTNTDNHIIPFRNSANEMVGVEIQGAGASLGLFTATTYGTNEHNQPFPPAVNALQNNSGSNNSHKTMDRFFHISKSAGGSATVSFYYTPSEMAGVNAITEANLQAQRWNGTKWEDPRGTVDQALNKVTISGLTSFSDWTLVDNSSPLPVEMQSFSATPNGKTVLVAWLTGVEKNNDRFEIEKSTDATNFETIGSVKGSNIDNTSYSFTDHSPTLGTSYYKLKQVDFDGYFTYSEVRAVLFTDDGFISVYPTQTQDLVYFNFNGKKGETSLIISDMSGRTVFSETFNCENQQVKTLSCKNWGAGLYVVKIKTGQTDLTSKLIVH